MGVNTESNIKIKNIINFYNIKIINIPRFGFQEDIK